MLIPDWGPTTFFTNGVLAPDAGQLRQLQARGVIIESEGVTEIGGERAAVKLRDGRVIELDGLFIASRVKVSSPLAEQLGCEFAESPIGLYVKTDGTQETSVAGAFACGDIARAAGSISFAIGDGALAGMATHRSLIYREAV
jgi:thioredoxin reductase